MRYLIVLFITFTSTWVLGQKKLEKPQDLEKALDPQMIALPDYNKAIDLLNNERFLIKSIGIGFLVSSALSLFSIFINKNRKNQFVLGRLNILINFYLLGVLIFESLSLPGETYVSKKGIGVFLPIIVIVFLAMANRAIRKDENLVKSVDRLR